MNEKRPKQRRAKMPLYRLIGDDFSAEHRAPSDVVALSWATGVLCYRDVNDNRPGEVAPPGDYDLVMVGERKIEPLWKIRKGGASLVSWVAA